MTEKQILEQIEKLNEQERFGEIAELIEKLGEKEKTPRVLSELARAYISIAVKDYDNLNVGLLKRSVEILEGIEDKFPENDHLLNFRLGRALFYLDRAGAALERFNKAFTNVTGDKDAEDIAKLCHNRVTLPIFKKCFAQRIADGWERFAAGESELRRLISEKADSDAITGCCSELLSEAFSNPCFEVGFNGEKYDLILSPEMDKLMLYLYDAFKKQAPESVTKHWNILLGRQQTDKNFALGFHGKQVAPSEITVRTEQDENGFKIVGYCEQLAPLLVENRGEAFWFFDILLDMTLGEIVNMRYIDTIDLAEKPFEGIPLLELPAEMEKLFGEKEGWDSVESYLDNYSGYEMQPREFAEDEYPTPRLDAFVCFSTVPQLMFEYLNGEHRTINKADNDGVAAGFIFFPAYVFEDDENAKRGKKILDFRDELEAYINGKAGESVVFVGGASGIDNCYLDFLAWDLKAVLDAAAEFFAKQDAVPWAYYQSYRTDVGVITLLRGDGE
ncbi:MAG: hypothetical protein K2J77_10685 [Oscillospiraceae bacterium]|nr:hypothetical protein [Oscillospiraceae bacterium]